MFCGFGGGGAFIFLPGQDRAHRCVRPGNLLQYGEDIGCAFGEACGDDADDVGRRIHVGSRCGAIGFGHAVPCCGIVLHAAQPLHRITPQHCSGAEVIAEERLAAFVRFGDGGRQAFAGTRIERNEARFVQTVRLEQIVVHDLAGPAGRAGIEAALAARLGIGEQVGAFEYLAKRRQLGIFLDHVFGDVPAFDAAVAQHLGCHLDAVLAHRAFDHVARGIDPQFGCNVGLAPFGHRGERGHGIARDHLDLTAVAFL